MHLSLKILNPTPTKNILLKFQNFYIYIYIYIFTNGPSIESLLHPTFIFLFFFRVAIYIYVFVLEEYTCCIDS